MIDDGMDLEALFADLPMPEIESIGSVDEPPAGPPDEPPAPASELKCEVCSTPLVYSGRGRRPKRCPEHRKTTTAGAKRAVSSGRVTNAMRESLIDDLTKELAFFGTGMSKVMPTTGVTVFKKSEQTAKALVKIAGDNPRLLGALELTARAASFIDLGDAGLAIGVAALVDLGRMSPDSAMANMTGVSQTFHEINDDGDSQDAATVADQLAAQRANGSPFSVEVPPRFQKVT